MATVLSVCHLQPLLVLVPLVFDWSPHLLKSSEMDHHPYISLSSPHSLRMLSSMTTPAPQFYIASSTTGNRNLFIPLRRTDFNIFQDPSLRVVHFREEMPEFSPIDSRVGRNRSRFYSPYPSQDSPHYRARNHHTNISHMSYSALTTSVPNMPRIVARATTPRNHTRNNPPRAVTQAVTPRLPPINETRIVPRANSPVPLPVNDLEAAPEAAPEESLSEQDEEESLHEKIPKPDGEAGRPNRGGYNLSQVLNWTGQDFEAVKVRVPAHHLPSLSDSSELC